MRSYLVLQQQQKDEKIDLQYLFRSELTQRELPSGVHKGSVTITKGMSSDDVCRLVREDVSRLGDKFKLLEVAGVKEDRDHLLVCCAGGRTIGSFIAPVSITFVELGALPPPSTPSRCFLLLTPPPHSSSAWAPPHPWWCGSNGR